jgi:hypothetical protein
LTSILAITTHATTSGAPIRAAVTVAVPPAIAIVITTGANMERGRAIAMMMTRARSDAVPATNGKARTDTGRVAIMMLAGSTAIGTG